MTFALIWLQVGTGGVATIRLEDLNPLPVTCKTNYFIGCIWLRQCSKPRGWLTHTVFNLQHGSSSTSPHTSSFILCRGVWWASSKSAQKKYVHNNHHTVIICTDKTTKQVLQGQRQPCCSVSFILTIIYSSRWEGKGADRGLRVAEDKGASGKGISTEKAAVSQTERQQQQRQTDLTQSAAAAAPPAPPPRRENVTNKTSAHGVFVSACLPAR